MGQFDQNSVIENEAMLVEQAKTDDRAFEKLYNYYFPQIYGFIIKRAGQRELAEDIVSTVFMKVFTHLNDYEPKTSSFKSWVYKIATNTLIDHYRKSSVKNEFTVEEFPEVLDENQDPKKEMVLKEDQVKVRRILAELPAQYQEILLLKFFSQLSNIEISETLEISANNVGVLLYRALKKFDKVYHNQT